MPPSDVRGVVTAGIVIVLGLAACSSHRTAATGASSGLARPTSRTQSSSSTASTATVTPRLPAPGHAPAAPHTGGGATIAGCPLFPADNPWRQDISKLPVSSHSVAWVASVGSTVHLHPDFGSNPSYGIPYVVVPASQPKVRVTFTAYGSESDRGPYPIPSSARVESGGDGHVLVASGNCKIYELYGASRSGSGWKAASGAVFDLTSDALRPAGWTSADAAGLPILPGLVRRDEARSGAILHALRFTVSRTQRGFISPARHEAGSTSSASYPPMGARFRLKASYDLSRFHGDSLVILRALKTYGMFVADNGSDWFLSGATDPSWNDNDLNQLKTVPGSAFDVVDTGPIRH